MNVENRSTKTNKPSETVHNIRISPDARFERIVKTPYTISQAREKKNNSRVWSLRIKVPLNSDEELSKRQK